MCVSALQIKGSWRPKWSKQSVIFHGADWCDSDRSSCFLPGTIQRNHVEGLRQQLPQPWSGQLLLVL